MSVSYELYTQKGGNWLIDSVYDAKDEAVQNARMVLESRFVLAVRIIEESYDDKTGETLSKIVFSAQKGQERTQRRTETKAPAAVAPVATGDIVPPPPPRAGLVRTLLKGVLILGALALLALGAMYVMLDVLG
ncbi:MAG: hypothetical protein KDE22_16155 [Rhodobacterales bacterium]|nr:hypothetical protein [Rhodobacterales bacterium]